MTKRKMVVGGREFEGEEVEFESEREGWSIYLLQDGTTLKLKSVLSQVLRVDGQYAPNGDPLYVVNVAPVLNTTAPEHLRKKT
jgi:hypothetical protein